jgi:type II secretion system protein G
VPFAGDPRPSGCKEFSGHPARRIRIGDFVRVNRRPTFWKPQIANIQISEFDGAIQSFQNGTSRYPTSTEGLDALVHNPGNVTGWYEPYIAKNIPLDPWGRAYIYKCPGDHGPFDLYSCGPDKVPGTADDIVIWKNPH